MVNKRGGSDTIREKGWKGVVVSFPPDVHEQLKIAAALSREGNMSAFIRRIVEKEIQKVIEEFRKE